MNCGIYCLKEYLDMYQILLQVDEDPEEVSMLELIRFVEKYNLHMNGYYSKRIEKNAPYIIYLPKEKHFMLVKRIGWMVDLCDPRIGMVSIPYFLYFFIYQGYYLKIDENSFRQDVVECV